MNNLNSKPNLATKNAQDFFIGQDGSRYISQSRVANMCGVSRQAISKLIKRKNSPVAPHNLNENNQLDAKSVMALAEHYALHVKSPTKQAKHFYAHLAKGGSPMDYEYKEEKLDRSGEAAGFVYFIRCNEWVKIGKAKNVKSRLKSLQTSSPYKLKVAYIVAAKDYTRMEAFFHNEYKAKRGMGEWFKLSDADMEYIKANY